MSISSPLRKLTKLFWGHWQTNELWQRIFKSSLSCIICASVAVVPPVVAIYGLNTYLIPMTSVFANPGQRMAKMIESLLLIVFGTILGLGWASLGLHLSTLVIESNAAASSTIRAMFVLVTTLIHGYVRSSTPRLFVAVWLFLVASFTTLMGRATEVTLAVYTSMLYPILTGTAIVMLVNLLVFPELSTSYLGSSTIETLFYTMNTVSRATHWFVTPGGDSEEAKKEQAESKTTDNKKETWFQSFLKDFPNPFEVTGSKYTPLAEDLHLTSITTLSDERTKLRAALQSCKAAQDEVNFEYSISPLSPKALKPISKQGMSGLVQNVVTLIGACENKYVLMNTDSADDDFMEGNIPPPEPHLTEAVPVPAAPNILDQVPEMLEDEEEEQLIQDRIEDAKPQREIESGSVEVLEATLKRLRGPVQDFEIAFRDATTLTVMCIAYCFDVPKLPSGARRPRGIEVEEIDLRIDEFTKALDLFDRRSAEELKSELLSESHLSVDFNPRMEMFLISSFLLGLRQSSTHVLKMLRHLRELVDERRKRNDRPSFWAPHYADIRQWLSTAGEADAMVLPEKARKEVRTGKSSKAQQSSDSVEDSSSEDPSSGEKGDEEKALQGVSRPKRQDKKALPEKKSKKKDEPSLGVIAKARSYAADTLEWCQRSDDLSYALKLAIAVFIVSWPSFVTSWREWYGEVRGIWAPMQLVLVFEVSIGTSIFIFIIRLAGVIFGCAVGYASFEIGRGNRPAMVVILALGIIPCVYIQIATKYVKAGMISITTMCVVALAAMNQSGTAFENFYKRLVAFLVGSMVAILVEIFIYPVRARHRLVESLSSAVREVQNMHSAISVGIEGPEKPNYRSHRLHSRFQHARDKAQASLVAAETFLPFCLNEPRLKGSFKAMEPIYKEIIYVLHQIIDRMDTVVDLRKAYGSSVLEDLNAHVYAYRRNMAAANTLILFSVHEALTTWLPLPQFIPSSRLAQVRLINRVREALEAKGWLGAKEVAGQQEHAEKAAAFLTERKFLAWNANAAGHTEIIEYLEELVELTKLLVGVNAFRSGLLERPQYKDYVEQAKVARKGTAGLSPFQSAPAAAELGRVGRVSTLASEGQGDPLQRAATTAAAVQKFKKLVRSHSRRSPMPEENTKEEDPTEEALPMSLRRVGTRIHRETSVVRRRGFSTTTGAQ